MDDERISVERGSGNVFEDVGLPNPEAWLLRAERMLALRQFLRRRRLSTDGATRLLEATADEVQALRRFAITEISDERVAKIFERLPQDARIVTPATPLLAR